MSTYFWVGRNIGATATATDKVDQYCFNAPGNWIKETSTAWVTTNETPKYNDIFYIGGGVSLNSNIASKPGFTFAKSPCLYGGFSGNVSLGTWEHTSAVSTGTTYTTGAEICHLGDFGYSFPWIGGGITGDIRRWCAYRDGISLENAANFYTSANSTGFRNPSDNLKLKVKSAIYIYSDKVRIPSVYDAQGTPELHTQNTKFIVDVEPIKCLGYQVPYPGLPSGNVNTILQTYTFNGGGVRIRNGFLYKIVIDTLIYSTSQTPSNIEIPNLPEYKYDAGIEIYNTIAHTVESAGWCRQLHKDCTYAKMKYYTRGSGFTYFGYSVPGPGPGGFIPLKNYTTTQELNFQSSLDQYLVYDVLYGVTGSAADGIRDSGIEGFGVLDIIGSASSNIVLTPNDPEGRMAWELNERLWTEAYIIPTRSREYIRSMVFPIKLGGGSSTSRIPFVKANSLQSAVSSMSRSVIPISIQIAGNVDIGTIYAGYGARVEAANEVDSTSIARIGEITLEKSAKVDFGTRGSHFTNWFIGGLSGGSASQEGVAYGGIVFKDDIAGTYVRGGPHSIFWNTQTEEGFNIRQPSVAIPEVGLPEPLIL